MISRIIIVVLILLLPSLVSAYDIPQWDKECLEGRGCLHYLDVIHQSASEMQYISIFVAIRDTDRKAEFISFHYPPGSSNPKIVFINEKFEPREETYRSLSFQSCDEESCVVRLKGGIVPGEPALNLLHEMGNSSIIWFMYEKEGKKVWALAPCWVKTLLLPDKNHLERGCSECKQARRSESSFIIVSTVKHGEEK